MTETYKIYQHNPPHLFRRHAKYFITGATYEKVHYMKSDPAKERLLHSIFKGFTNEGWEVEDWVILNNHYHLMVNAPENAEALGDIIRDIHRFTAIWIKRNVDLNSLFMECIDRVNACTNTVGARQNTDKNKVENVIQKKIFHNYWDTCITYEESYYARLNYIWFNAVKHGYVDAPINWKYCSYYYRFRDEKDNLRKIQEKYPCDKVNVYDEF